LKGSDLLLLPALGKQNPVGLIPAFFDCVYPRPYPIPVHIYQKTPYFNSL